MVYSALSFGLPGRGQGHASTTAHRSADERDTIMWPLKNQRCEINEADPSSPLISRRDPGSHMVSMPPRSRL